MKARVACRSPSARVQCDLLKRSIGHEPSANPFQARRGAHFRATRLARMQRIRYKSHLPPREATACPKSLSAGAVSFERIRCSRISTRPRLPTRRHCTDSSTAATIVWVMREAKVRHVTVGPLQSHADFLRGDIARSLAIGQRFSVSESMENYTWPTINLSCFTLCNECWPAEARTRGPGR